MTKLEITTALDNKIDCSLYHSSIDSNLVIISPGIGISKNFYHDFASFLNKFGFNVITFNYRGVKPYRPEVSLQDWGKIDIDAVLEYAKRNYPSSRIFFLGHSISSHLLPLAKNSKIVRKAYFVASNNLSYTNWRGINRLRAFLFFHATIPISVKLYRGLPGYLYGGRKKIPYEVAREWAKFGKHKSGVAFDEELKKNKLSKINLESKFVAFTDDRHFCTIEGVAIQSSYYFPSKCEVISHKITPNKKIGHFGFFNPDNYALWQDVLNWFM